MKGAAVVIGASGGIGRAFVEALSDDERFGCVHAVSRSVIAAPNTVRRHRADVTDEASLAAAAATIGAEGQVELVIVATGILHEDGLSPEKTYRALAPDALARVFAVNTIGPALVAKHFLPLLPRQGRAVFAVLSARVGSIEDNRLGGWYGYRASKAALNQIIRTLAIEAGRNRPDAIVIGLHPGTVATTLSRPFRPDDAASGIFTPQESVAHLLRVIELADRGQSGRVIAWDGRLVPF